MKIDFEIIREYVGERLEVADIFAIDRRAAGVV